jgi:hypothetical protein
LLMRRRRPTHPPPVEQPSTGAAIDIRQVHYPASLPLPFLRGVVGQLSQCFGLGNANPDRQMRTLQNRSADLFAELRQVPAVANASQVAKSFVNTVNFDAGLISSTSSLPGSTYQHKARSCC